MTSLDNLKNLAALVRSAIERSAEQSKMAEVGHTSEFWADIFSQRRIYPDVNEIMVCRREGTILGIGDDPQGGIEKERVYSERVHHLFRQMVDKEFISRLPEPTFGSPLVFEHDSISRSANFWINSATTKRVAEFARLYGPKRRLRILEIGPGWGACVYQLHHVLDIDSYTLVDLPENLYISTIHLGTELASRKLNFIDVKGESIDEIPANSISACLPGAISRIRGKFDLVLNSFSLQEMDIESVNGYIDWIQGALAPDGIFVSLNSHAKAGVKTASDYRYDRFHIHHWGVFRTSPSGFYNTIPYEVVVGLRQAQTPSYPVDCQNGLAWLMQLGLDGNLNSYCTGLVRGTLNRTEMKVLAGYNQFFVAESDIERGKLLQQLGEIDTSCVWSYVSGLFCLVRNDRREAGLRIETSCKNELAGFARIRANLILAALTEKTEVGNIASDITFDPLLAYPEAKQILSTKSLDALIAHANRVFGRLSK